MKPSRRVATKPFDAADYLKTASDRAAFLEACANEAPDDVAFLAKALGVVARSEGMSRVARRAGVPRESLYRALSEKGNPELATLVRVTKALGVRIAFKTA